MLSLATAQPEQKPLTRREYVEQQLDAIERRARERKVPYAEFLASQRKAAGTDALVALLVKHAGPALQLGGTKGLRDYIELEAVRQRAAAVQAGYADFSSFQPSGDDLTAISDAIQRILEVVAAA